MLQSAALGLPEVKDFRRRPANRSARDFKNQRESTLKISGPGVEAGDFPKEPRLGPGLECLAHVRRLSNFRIVPASEQFAACRSEELVPNSDSADGDSRHAPHDPGHEADA
jgi:hypothetical protein